MPTQVTNYQCPACTGPLHFSGASGRLECDYCGTGYDVSEIEAIYAHKEEQAAAAQRRAEEKAARASEPESEWDTSDMSGNWGADAAGMKSYTCPSCGAELICDESTAATSCPYCGNPTVVPGQFSGTLKPDYVIPFKLSKEDAVKALREHYKGKFLLPRSFKDSNHIEEIQGVYVPFWMFDGRADGYAEFHTTLVHTYESGDYEITETDHFDVRRAGSLSFQKVPVDASTRMPDAHMDAIEPFDYSELKPFSTAYLPGFLADKYDVSAEDSRARADERCTASVLGALERTVTGYASCTLVDKDITLERGKVHYALLPVWMLSTKWQGKNFLFAMNGQTGKLIGDLPVDKKKRLATFAAIAAPLAAIGSAIALALVR